MDMATTTMTMMMTPLPARLQQVLLPEAIMAMEVLLRPDRRLPLAAVLPRPLLRLPLQADTIITVVQ